MRLRLAASNPMGKALLSVLLFEVIVVWLAFPGMVLVSRMPTSVATAATSIVTLLALAAAATLRRRPGYPLAWATQFGAIALGLLTPMMFLVGVVFATIWTASFVLGRRLEQSQRSLID